jgi:predicted O-methyltransferase YrrM
MKVNGGSVTTIEIDPAAAREAQENFRRAGLADVVQSRVNDALREIPALDGLFDLVFLDLGGPHHKELLDLVLPRLSPGGAVVSHNAYLLRFTDPAYLRAIRHSPGLESRFVPTLTGGMSVTVKQGQ